MDLAGSLHHLQNYGANPMALAGIVGNLQNFNVQRPFFCLHQVECARVDCYGWSRRGCRKDWSSKRLYLEGMRGSSKGPKCVARQLLGHPTSVSSKSYRLASGIVESPGNRLAAQRVTVMPYSVRCAKFGSSQHGNPRFYGLYSGFRCSHPGLQSTSMQAITADYDSSSGDGLDFSAAHTVDLPTELSGIGYFGAYLQEALENLKERRLLQISKQGFEEAYTKLKSVNAKSLLKDASQSVIVKQGARMWQTLEPWIKWPIAIFGAAYLLVLTSIGVTVAQDLAPLWILGPLFTGWMIRSVCLTTDFIHQCWVDSEPFRLAVMESMIHVYDDYKRGELFDKLGSLVESKKRELQDGLAKKGSDMVLYVKSGQAGTDFKALVLLRISQLIYWWSEKYEDFVEWARPFWRAFVRLIKKIF